MSSDPRAHFVARWFRRGVEAGDPFDRFFSLWIALVVAATKWCNDIGKGKPGDTDGKRIALFLKNNPSSVLRAIDARAEQMTALAKRRGRWLDTPVLDIDGETRHSRAVRAKLERFSRHYCSAMRLSDAEKVDALAEILNRVRNNTFHGVKVYDDEEDIRVLNLVNPLLQDIIRSAAGVAE
jgi:hypothetical protein